jgi:hypothetical protein
MVCANKHNLLTFIKSKLTVIVSTVKAVALFAALQCVPIAVFIFLSFNFLKHDQHQTTPQQIGLVYTLYLKHKSFQLEHVPSGAHVLFVTQPANRFAHSSFELVGAETKFPFSCILLRVERKISSFGSN